MKPGVNCTQQRLTLWGSTFVDTVYLCVLYGSCSLCRGLYNGQRLCSLWCTNWILTCNLNELYSSKGWENARVLNRFMIYGCVTIKIIKVHTNEFKWHTNFFLDMSWFWRAIKREGIFTHVFHDKLISFTLINKIDHIFKISEPSVLNWMLYLYFLV